MAEHSSRSIDHVLADLAFARRLARSLATPGVDPEDLLQEGLLRALQRPPEARASTRPWIARVLGNLASNARRAAGRERTRGTGDDRDPLRDDPARLEAELDGHRRLATVLASLDEPYRSTIVRRYYRDLTCAEIALADGVPESTTRARHARGLELLREALDEQSQGRRGVWLAWLAPLLGGEREVEVGTGASIGAVASLWIGLAALAVVSSLVIAEVLGRSNVDAATNTELASVPVLPNETVHVDAGIDSAPASRLEPRTTADIPKEASVRQSPAGRATLRARAVDERGHPIGTAILERLGNGSPSSPAHEAIHARPDGSLEFPIDLGARSRPGSLGAADIWVHIHALGHCDVMLSVNVVPGGTLDLGELVLARSGSIRGRIVDDLGAPIDATNVLVTYADLDFDEQARWPEIDAGSHEILFSKVTGADGLFEIAGVAEGVYRVWAYASGYVPRASSALSVSAAVAIDAEALTLRRVPVAIRGVVVDESGTPLGGIRVDQLVKEGFEYAAFTDENGRFALDTTQVEGVVLHFHDTDERVASALHRGVEPTTSELVFVLPPPRPARFLVRDEEGTPIPEFTHTVELSESSSLAQSAFTDASGLLEIVPPIGAFTLRIRAAGFDEGVWHGVAADHEGEPTPVVLERAPRLHGRVLLADGTPGAGLQVMLAPIADPIENNRFTDFPLRFDYLAGSDSTQTDVEGRFALTLRKEAKAQLVVTAGDRATGEFGPYTKSDPGLEKPLELVLAPTGSIAGRLIVPAGVALEGEWVGVCFGDMRVLSQRVGVDGRFRFDGLAPGQWWIHRLIGEGLGRPVSAPRHPPPRIVQVDAGMTKEIELDLRSCWTSKITGVLHHPGIDTRGWFGLWRPEHVDQHRTPIAFALDGSGTFRSPELEPGRGTLVLRDSGSGVLRRELCKELELGFGEHSMELRLEPARLRWSGSAASKPWAVVARTKDGVTMTTVVRPTSATTSLEFSVPAGAWEIRSVGESGLPTGELHRSVVVEAGAVLEWTD